MKYSQDIIDLVWDKAKIVPNNSDQFRQDFSGAWIKKKEYNENTSFGWKIVLIKPVESGGSDTDINNLFPFHWKNAQEKGKSFPCALHCFGQFPKPQSHF